jgi:hypothetical protein
VVVVLLFLLCDLIMDGISLLGAYQAPLAVVDGEVIPYDLYTSLSNNSLHQDVPIVFGM